MKFCQHCRSYKPTEEFYIFSNGKCSQYCKECTKAIRRQQYREKHPMHECITQQDGTHRWVRMCGKRASIYWTPNMVSDLKRYFPTTSNAELVEIFGMSHRSITRQAQKLGLVKDSEYIRSVKKEMSMMGHIKKRSIRAERLKANGEATD